MQATTLESARFIHCLFCTSCRKEIRRWRAVDPYPTTGTEPCPTCGRDAITVQGAEMSKTSLRKLTHQHETEKRWKKSRVKKRIRRGEQTLVDCVDCEQEGLLFGHRWS